MIEQTVVQFILSATTFFSLGTALGIFIRGVVIQKEETKTEMLVDKDLEINSIIHHHTE